MLKQTHVRTAAGIALAALFLSGCGGSGSARTLVATPLTVTTKVGNMAVKYESAKAPVSVTASGEGAVVAGLSGASFTNLTYTPVPNIKETTIAYSENGEVRALPLSTGVPQTLTQLVPQFDVTAGPCYSHDGRIVFQGLFGNKLDFGVMNDDGSDIHSIQPAGFSGAAIADWAVNGDIAFTTFPDLYTMSPSGLDLENYAPSWTGVQTVTVSGASGGFTLTFEGQTTASLSLSASPATVQSALGALSSVGPGAVAVTGSAGDYEVDFGGSLAGVKVPLLTLGFNGKGTGGVSPSRLIMGPHRPAWSPDSAQIAACCTFGTTPVYNGIAILSSTGSVNNVIPTAYTVGGVAWSPDGSKLAFALPTPGAAAIYGWELSTGYSWYIHFPYDGFMDSDPSFSPDGGQVVFARATNPPSLWTAQVGGIGAAQLVTSQSGSDVLSPNWSPFPSNKTFVGTGGQLGATASGFLLGQTGSGFVSLLTFNATTPSTATITDQGSSSGAAPIGFLLKADSITNLEFANAYYGKTSYVIPAMDAATSQALVFFDGVSGQVSSVIPVTGKKRPVPSNISGAPAYDGTFSGVWNGAGKNLAPRGATHVEIDPKKGTVIRFR